MLSVCHPSGSLPGIVPISPTPCIQHWCGVMPSLCTGAQVTTVTTLPTKTWSVVPACSPQSPPCALHYIAVLETSGHNWIHSRRRGRDTTAESWKAGTGETMRSENSLTNKLCPIELPGFVIRTQDGLQS